ncbi:MAG: 16S rRNA (uracil(1498)-N(3))-methyltransferase [Clostridia bacterium]|nr:16S rRNA (uracil(1498)-N(3))-methyltransferase [Clostridia bacterium]
MEIRRFFVSQSDIIGDTVTVSGDEFLHMTKVLRYKVGYKAIVCANDGKEYVCTIKRIANDYAELSIDECKVADRKNVSLTLFAGLLKNNKLDFAIQKSVELGVDKIIPFTSANCAETKFSAERANKIALEAAKQCGSAYLSEVGELTDLDGIINDFKNFDDVLLAYEDENDTRLTDNIPNGKRIALIVGPEGGFQPEEVARMRAAGAKVVTLGRRILRAETASIVGSALILSALDF